ncbi:kinase binding protein CGI-121-domain-containing protein [Lentinula lateritia]|uniref:Kinase binding protein CGI-121-domain-containing protein n=1 Tax=Lentinula aff. lateritia TaxID=2804960 RepID=A0ACC1U3W9_9AGAR|nr:kinase binding protein CGI-121-domain-containing protein [Lentinula aff. lateritia]KAJ3857224.1 kinase binding protein CGI-121-domain-containing protein [Lentinula lateritia]
MESFRFNHNNEAHAMLFYPVSNPGKIKQRIIDAAKSKGHEAEEEREAVNFSFIDASLITSRLHLETALNQAILAESQGSLRTKTVHSEILFALNPTNNITEAIRRYGVSDTTKALLVVQIVNSSATTATAASISDVEIQMKNVVNGTIVSFDELAKLTDWNTVEKYHKLGNEVKEKRDVAQARAFIDNVAVSSVAMKSVMQ